MSKGFAVAFQYQSLFWIHDRHHHDGVFPTNPKGLQAKLWWPPPISRIGGGEGAIFPHSPESIDLHP